MESSSSEDDEPYFDISSHLPLKLEHICLISIINELENYPIELLALLPRHLRYRLLSNIPNFDLNRLDHTPVAQGIDIDELWEKEAGKLSREIDEDFMFASLFVTDELEPNVIAASKSKSLKELYFLTLMWNILVDIGTISPRHISETGLDYTPKNFVYTEALDGLVAVRSHNFLVQLPGATKWKDLPNCKEYYRERRDFNEYESATLDSYRQLWRKQAIPLKKQKRYGMGIGYDTHILLIPQHLLPIHQSNGPLEVLNHLIVGCNVQPLNLNINVNELHPADSNLKLYYQGDTKDESYHLFLRTLLEKIVILKLTGLSAEQVATLQYIFHSVIGDGGDSSLRVLELCSGSVLYKLDLSSLSTYLCTLPSNPPSLPRYQQLRILKIASPPDLSSLPHLSALIEQQHLLNHVYLLLFDSCPDEHDKPASRVSLQETQLCDALSLLVSRREFQSLTVSFICKRFPFRSAQMDMNCLNLFPFTKLLHSFMISPCAHKQTLYLEYINSSTPRELTPVICSSSEGTVPDCGKQHKCLIYHFDDTKTIVSHLIQLPVIQLQDLVFKFEKGTESLLNLVAGHCNMNVTSMHIKFGIKVTNDPQEVQSLFTTLHDDFEKIFQMNSLEKFSLSGEWLCCSEIKKALVNGIHQQVRVGSLKTLRLEHNSVEYWTGRPNIPYKFSESELRELWSAIFTLPQVDQFEIELDLQHEAILEFIDMVNIICDCSTKEKKLKSMQLGLHEDWNFSEIWETGMLEPFKTVTHKLDIMLDYYRRSPEILHYSFSA